MTNGGNGLVPAAWWWDEAVLTTSPEREVTGVVCDAGNDPPNQRYSPTQHLP